MNDRSYFIHNKNGAWKETGSKNENRTIYLITLLVDCPNSLRHNIQCKC